MDGNTRVKTSVRIPKAIHASIRDRAQERGVSSHFMIIEALRVTFPAVPAVPPAPRKRPSKV